MSQPVRAVPKPSHARLKPRRGQQTKFSPKVRKQIIERDNGLCVRCRMPYHNIHHVVFASDLGPGTVDNGVCVCATCHSWAHADREGRRWFEKYRNKYLIGNLLDQVNQ